MFIKTPIHISYDCQIQKEMHMHKSQSNKIKYTTPEHANYFWRYSVIQFRTQAYFSLNKLWGNYGKISYKWFNIWQPNLVSRVSTTTTFKFLIVLTKMKTQSLSYKLDDSSKRLIFHLWNTPLPYNMLYSYKSYLSCHLHCMNNTV